MTLNQAIYMTMANKSLKRFTVRDPARRVATEKVRAETVQQMAVRIPVISPRWAIGIVDFRVAQS
jgi:hypothetical protein